MTKTARSVTPTIIFPTKIFVLFTAIINVFKPLMLFSSDDLLLLRLNTSMCHSERPEEVKNLLPRFENLASIMEILRRPAKAGLLRMTT
jgi:hypothetical protein